MGLLKHLDRGDTFHLVTQTMVGRGPAAQLRLRANAVSSAHAAIHWTGEHWSLRDLGSRNGTNVGGRRLEPGEAHALVPGEVVQFGGAREQWRVEGVDAPQPLARSGERVLLATDGILLLTDPDDPEVVVYEDADDGWIQERDLERTRVSTGSTIVAGGEAWQLWLPSALGATFEATGRMPELGELRVTFGVSSDEEFVEVFLSGPDGFERLLEARSYHYMLLTLARQRLDDADEAEPERGWVDRDHLAKMLRVSPRTLTVHLCRARKQWSEAGVLGAADLIEARPSVRQLRLGIDGFEIGPLRHPRD